MAHLTLAGVSDDGSRLLLVDDEGVEHSVEIDQRLRTAVGGDSRRLENKMDSALRPRDIQTRIRAGETPETVAQPAQTSVDKIMAFAAPALAERQHVAQRAQRSSVRRPEGTGGARALGDAVGAHLRALNIDPETVEWDAWRREDGRWPLTASYTHEGRAGTAEFLFDAPGNYVTLENDDARWLVGEAVPEAEPEPVADDLRQARQRRLSAVGELDDQLPLGDDAIDLVTEQPVEAFLDTGEPTDPEIAAEEAELREEAAEAAAEDDFHAKPEHHEPQRREVKKTRGRASVPSWDEIMFGGGKSE
jgi:hypothetical protein